MRSPPMAVGRSIAWPLRLGGEGPSWSYYLYRCTNYLHRCTKPKQYQENECPRVT